MQEVVIGGTYQHYKGKYYKVLGIAKHSETNEDLVIYVGLYEPLPEQQFNSIRARPKHMFLEEIERNGQTFSRFTYLEK